MKEPLQQRDFFTLASRVFRFLVVDFGFSRPKREKKGKESSLVFSKSNVSVSIVYEGGCTPEVLLRWHSDTHNNYAGIEALTNFVIHISYPNELASRYRYTKSMHSLVYSSWMAMQADYLLLHGRQFLGGEYMFLHEVIAMILTKSK